MATDSDYNSLEGIIDDIFDARLKSAVLCHFHSQIIASDIRQDVGMVAKNLRSCLNHLCTFLYNRYATSSRQPKEFNDFPFFYRRGRNIERMFDRFERKYSELLFGRTEGAFKKEQINVLKVFFEFQPGNRIQINGDGAFWLQTLRTFRNDVEHHKKAIVIDNDVDGGKLQFVEVEVPAKSRITLASIVITKWTDVVTQIFIRTLQCIDIPPTNEKLSNEYLSWNNDVIIVNKIAIPWREYLRALEVAKELSENSFRRCIFTKCYITNMITPTTIETLVPNSEVRSSKNASLNGAKDIQKRWHTRGTKNWPHSAAKSSPHLQAMPEEKTESKSKRAKKSCPFTPSEREAIKLMGELAKEAELQYAKCWKEYHHINTCLIQLTKYSGECLGSLDSLLHDISYFLFRYTANNEDQNKDIAVGKVEFLYDESIRRSGKGKKVNISFKVCDAEPKFSEEKRTKPQEKVLKAVLEGYPKSPVEDGFFKNENSAAYFLHVLFFLSRYMTHNSILVVKEGTEYQVVNDTLFSEQNNLHSRIPINKNEMYIEIPKLEQLVSNGEDNERMSRPAYKEPFPDVLLQLIKFVTGIVRKILCNLTSESEDKELIDNLFGKERVYFDEKYLQVDDKRIEWEDYMRAIKISQGEFS